MEESQLGSIIISYDNKSMISMMKNLVFHNKTKHISIKYHFLQVVSNKEIEFKYYKVEEQLADIL